MMLASGESPTVNDHRQIGSCQTKIGDKNCVSVSIRRACAYISRRFSCVFWSGYFPETQSAFLIGLESAEEYPLAVNDFPQTREIPKKHPKP
ncbi:hypothetical protein TNCV_2020521 [Trichonephila clavipes]|nr:hypothetical protein TNCV_2020521 [Trichonephila clavipes]